MKITEENFVLQLKNRNEKALEYVIATYGWIIKSIVKKHLYNLESHQEECINDILLAIWNNIYRFDEDKNTFKNWVAAISKYKTIDYRRKYLKDLRNKNKSRGRGYRFTNIPTLFRITNSVPLL